MKSKNDEKSKTKNKKAISRKEKSLLAGAIAVLAVAILCVVIFLLYPKLAGRPDWQIIGSLDFDDSTWIEDMAYNRVKPTEKLLDVSSSFVYSTDTAYITATYASGTTVENAKKYFLSQIPDSVDRFPDEDARLNIVGELNGEKYDIINYEADMFVAYDTKITIDREKADTIKEKLIKEFPVDVVKKVPELAQVTEHEKLGGYVMYNDDELSSSSYAGIPIFSEAYRYQGTIEDLIKIEKAIKDKYPESLFFEEVATVYFKDQGHIFSLSAEESDLNILAVITVQRIPEKQS